MKRWNIRSPQAPGDIQPVPLEQRPLTDIGFTSSVAQRLVEDGIMTVGHLLAAFPDEDFTGIPGVGPTTQEKINRMLRAYRE